MTNLPTAQTNIQLYNRADETFQNSIINTYPKIYNTSPNCHMSYSTNISRNSSGGIANNALQVDMLVKAKLLKILEQNISLDKAFEMAMWDQNEISRVSDMAGLQMSAYCQQRWAQDVVQSTAICRHERTMAETRPRQNEGRGCSSRKHERDQVIGHWCALHGARCAEHDASKTTLRVSTSGRARRNKVLCDVLRTRKPLWMSSLCT